MFHRLHLLVEYSDDENIVFALPIKNGVSLVVVTANAVCDCLALMPHQWGVCQKTQGVIQIVGVSVGLVGAKVEEGVFVDSSEVFSGKPGELIHRAFSSPGPQSRAETVRSPRFSHLPPPRFSAPPSGFPAVPAGAGRNARPRWLSRSVPTRSTCR